MNNPKGRIDWIVSRLNEDGSLSYVDCWGIYGAKWGKTKNTFNSDWKKANEQHKEIQRKIKEAKDRVIISEAEKNAKNGLKSKAERLMILQDMIDDSLSDIKDDLVSLGEKVKLRRLIKDIQAEISKIEGDYAPEKSEVKINELDDWTDDQIEEELERLDRINNQAVQA